MTVDIQAFIREEAATAAEDIGKMSKKDPPTQPLGQINPKPISAARGLFFYHTRKVGLVVGAKWGNGFLITRVGGPGETPVRWSAPVFYRVHEGSIGFTAGGGFSHTLIALGTQSAIDAFKKGKAVLGDDFSLALLTGTDDSEESNVFDKGWKESVAWSSSGGLLLDTSLTGGRITVDTEHNELLYGVGVTASQIVDAASTVEPPAAFAPVYDVVNGIVAAAAADPRKFHGFKKHWSPQNPLDPSPSTY